MLFKRRLDEMSLPDGLMKAKVNMVRGMAVCRTLDSTTGEYEITLPSAKGAEIYGFVTLRADEAVYKISDYDNIKAGQRAVVYTLVPNAEWATDQFTGTIAVGDKVTAGIDGKLVKVETTDEGMVRTFAVIATADAGAGYEKATITIKV